MHKFLRNRYVEKTALWGTLTALNAPLAFLPLAITGLSRLFIVTQSHDVLAKEAAKETRSLAIPEQETLSRIARDMGQKAGITIKHVLVRNNDRFRNAEVFGESRKATSLIFQGNPLQDPVLNQTPQGEAVMRGVIAHELGHALSNSDNTFKNNAYMTGLCYCLSSSLGTITGLIAIASGGLALGAGLIGGAILSAGAGFLTMALNQRFSRNEEYLADLRCADLFSADDMVICHDYNLKVLRQEHGAQQKPQTQPKPQALGQRFVVACINLYGDDHPEPQDRIDALRTVFGTTACYTVSNKTPAKSGLNPQSGGASCTHS
jgi:Zn-dependent protease with chaperone function